MTVLATAPTAYKQILNAGRIDQLAGVRAAVSAGEHIPLQTWQRIHDALGLKIIDGIGGTELLHIFISAAGDDIRPGATGRPVPGYRATILGPDGDELPPGVEGRLAVIGPVGCRYLDDERQAKYVVDGWNVTGDTFVRDEDGYFYYQARTDNMIVSSGYNIGGPEVEAVIDSHPDVVESAVVGRPDADRGSVVCAFVVLSAGVVGDAAKARELQDYVKAQLAPYKYPRDVRFTDALPRNTSGKLQHFRLRAQVEAEAQAADGPATCPPGPEGNPMKIAIAGGGPGGLYFAALMKELDPRHEVTVWERNAAEDTFGFGVVFSDETLGGIESADTVVYGQMESRFARWTDIDIEFNGAAFTVGGQGFAAMSRKELLQILQARADAARRHGALPDRRRRTRTSCAPPTIWWSPPTASTRPSAPSTPTCSGPHWTGGRTSTSGSAPTWSSRRSSSSSSRRSGARCRSTATRSPTRARPSSSRCTRTCGAAPASTRTEDRVFPPGVSDEYAVARIAEIFADELGGHAVLTNNSKWLNFTTVRNERWHDGNLVLLGDAAHTAHFSIGSGTKLAMEDALALAACLHEQPDVDAGARGLPGRAQAGRRVDPARGAGLAGVVREHRHVRRPGPGHVLLQPAHPLPPDHLREPQGPRRRVRRPDGGRSSPAPRG